jgi:hypothetical protein
MTAMLNVRDECDLPDDDGYDLFTRETEVERRGRDELPLGASPPSIGRPLKQDRRCIPRAYLYGAK